MADTEWLDILIDNKIMQINSKGELRDVPEPKEDPDSRNVRKSASHFRKGRQTPVQPKDASGKQGFARSVGRQRKTGT